MSAFAPIGVDIVLDEADCIEIFRRGKRLNFVPMIKPEMIDRAIDIALEKA
ncbi:MULTISPECIES: DUF6990 domain-containing protein [Sinorhizobium]|uniref:Uncharacterized protein n=3 Tax=Sinorhizobium TaxID=28105 RepID=H0FWD5_RHIML|nr:MULTISPECIES: hypothetical protein [Sinorhizobium]PII39605.1 hypothetical protein T190_02375 [Sinorhizobium meliloti CCBAU 01290]EHK78562.1 hypothetical protein SM0020_07487 [Sinorhizobium meliloti CCNWSX0020]MDE4592108.1 hypothetical protein [Sinorhizobium meliloti]MQW20920.1 hypothetical protein [Sinorhizobium meliloti]MQW29286.1 hypothetical protein [Sinorhizobium meliloti]